MLATACFEATDGFGFMSNTYDPTDYIANALGVALAVIVSISVQYTRWPRDGASDTVRTPK